MRDREKILGIVAILMLMCMMVPSKAQLPSPQIPQATPPKLIILVGEPVQMHIPGNGETWPGQIVRVHSGERPRVDLVAWDSKRQTWAEHHGIALDRGNNPGDPYYTVFRP